MNEIEKLLLQEMRDVFVATNTLTDDMLIKLQFVFHSSLEGALELVDEKAVTVLSSPSGRKIFQVIGSSGLPYVCFSTSSYCTCQVYKIAVLKKRELLMHIVRDSCVCEQCKHVLAARISEAIEITSKQDISDEEMSDLILQQMTFDPTH